MKKILILLLTLFIFPIQTIYGNELGIPKDRPLNLIYDPSNYINEDTENKLIELNKKYNEDLENQFEIGLVVIDTLNGENLENTANQIAKDWKIGFNSPEDKEKGILFLVAVNDRKYRSEISINGREIIPLSELDNISASVKNGFRQNDYSKGILTYLNKLDNEISKPNKSIDENTFLYKENFFPKLLK